MSADSSALFQPFTLGDLTLPNRLVMAPLTRNRATPAGDRPGPDAAAYYAQRASAGLLISEGSQISHQGQGYLRTPGIYTPEQVAGWRKVTDAVHKAGGRLFIQLWHVGRVSHTSLQPDGGAPVGPSALTANTKTYLADGFADVSEPRALELSEIPGILRDYENAARNAKEAGFDGVEIHAANGYLLDQFMKDGANKRTDAYGGSIENRARLTIEATEAVLKVWDKGRVGIRLSPAQVNDAADSNPQALFSHVIEKLDGLGLSYIHMIEGATQGDRNAVPVDYAGLRGAFRGAYIANNGYDRAMAAEAVASGRADLVAFGRLFIANPDLVERFRLNAPLNEPDRATFYGGDSKGYTDYPALGEAA
ncbi:alkene reductase [Microvirga subterranea]|uniref:N-ethylmaleimide reductase n=1 Tax=Microvirga subterranea TaxID=186651 RepID=A0A370HS25_9HYPH|nr:alkene reductase [Microvirga subterranea]RDI61100.1 N-ethylmaleimide reductase [Microvirga subterranea]